MSNDAFMILLMAGVPAVAITGLVLALRKKPIARSKKEIDLDLICYGALEGALHNFNPDQVLPPKH